MSEVFGPQYSSLYDVVYGDKDYGFECDAVEALLLRFGGKPSSILDLGCGTGGHTIELARRGYGVVGVDRSPDMVERARTKAAESGVAIEFHTSAIKDLDLSRTFDAALMMFAVFGYQITDADALGTLRSARAHLASGALLIFDVWFGPAVLVVGPEIRQRDIPSDGGVIRKSSAATLDLDAQVASVHMDLAVIESGEEVSRTSEVHSMRFFFPREIDLLLSATGFRRSLLAPFPDVEGPVTSDTWNVVVVAEAT